MGTQMRRGSAVGLQPLLLPVLLAGSVLWFNAASAQHPVGSDEERSLLAKAFGLSGDSLTRWNVSPATLQHMRTEGFKRHFSPWGGKRSAAFDALLDSPMSERFAPDGSYKVHRLHKSSVQSARGPGGAESFSPWGGKRADQKEQTFNPWGGKRGDRFGSWGGKRQQDSQNSFNPWGGKRSSGSHPDSQVDGRETDEHLFPAWGGKGAPDEFSAWAGKRVDGEGETFKPWGGKREDRFNPWGGKRDRLFNPWGGKKDSSNKDGFFNPWGGKRGPDDQFNPWGGKKQDPFNPWGGKRGADDSFNPWGGKRQDPFNPWGGKKEDVVFRPWGGRRQDDTFKPWGGKRGEDSPPSLSISGGLTPGLQGEPGSSRTKRDSAMREHKASTSSEGNTRT
ncbi:uncharacterized protein LOC144180290 [Haemaphysalis longicornis]